MRFYEVKVKVDRMMSSGAMKNVSEIYAVDAMTFTEAEARTTECVHTETEGVFEVIAEKRAQYDEVVFNDGEMFFLVKFILITTTTGETSAGTRSSCFSEPRASTRRKSTQESTCASAF